MPTVAESNSKQATIVTLALKNFSLDMMQLRSADYDIAGVDVDANSVDVVIRDSLQLRGLMKDSMQLVAAKTVDLSLTPDEGYKTPQEVEDFLKNTSQNFPQITRLYSIGKSFEGRDIWALKITDHPDLREPEEPAILINAMHHAREVMTVEVAWDVVEYLTRRYADDTQVKNWVDHNEIWVVPMLNPDGNQKVWDSDRLWRKNTHDQGVDINRNYPFQWNYCQGSSGIPFSDQYRGPVAASEPETRALMSLVAKIEPVIDLSLHSYSELVLYPMGCDQQYPDNRTIIESIGHELASKLIRDSGKGTYKPGTPWETLYAVDGDDIDWMWAQFHVMPFVVEMNNSARNFQPPYAYRQPTVERLRPGWQYLLDRLSGSGIRGQILASNGANTSPATITLRNLPDRQVMLSQQPVKRDGSFHVITAPGTFELTIHRGTSDTILNVTVGVDRQDLKPLGTFTNNN